MYLVNTLSFHRMDTTAKSVVLSINVDANIASNVEFEYEKIKKKFPGTYSTNGSKLDQFDKLVDQFSRSLYLENKPFNKN